MEPLAITGAGVVSPFGVGWSAWREALSDPLAAQGRAFGDAPTICGERGDALRGYAAEVWGWDPKRHLGPRGHRNLDRNTKFMLVAASEALRAAGVKDGEGFLVPFEPERVGICAATAYGSLDDITELNRVAELEDPRYISPTRFPNTVINSAAGYVAIREQLRAPNTTVVDGNCGALDALLTATMHLEEGRADAFLVGGGEVLSEPLAAAFEMLGLGRGRLRIGEGAAFVLLEPLARARHRGASLRAEVMGFGAAFEAPPREGLLLGVSPHAVRRAVASALRDAGIGSSDVDLVVSSASGLEWFDRAEREGIEALFGGDVAVAEPKRLLGETFGAGGAFGLLAALGWLDGVPLGEPLGSGRPLDVSPPRVLVVTAVGFYGNVSAVVLRAPSETGRDGTEGVER